MGLISRVSSRTYRKKHEIHLNHDFNRAMDGYTEAFEFKTKKSCPDSLSYNSKLGLLAVGGYNLDDAQTQTKSGEIYLLKNEPDTHELSEIAYFDDVGAVFDLVWNGNKIYACNTAGEVIVVGGDESSLEAGGDKREISRTLVGDEGATFTHIRVRDDGAKAVLADDKGSLMVYDVEKQVSVRRKYMNTRCGAVTLTGVSGIWFIVEVMIQSSGVPI